MVNPDTMLLRGGILLFTIAFAVCLKDEGDHYWGGYQKLMSKYMNDPEEHEKWLQHVDSFFQHPQAADIASPFFKCNTSRGNDIPTSVNKLRAGDIKVVGALGDSITAGFGILAESLPEVLIQERGYSHCVGGQRTYEDGVITVPNILKKYNNNLYGYSTGPGGVDDVEAMFNAAVGGATAPNMPDQADDLVSKMQLDTNVNLERDWKMITLFIGGNDLCRVCDYPEDYGSDAHVRNIESALDKLSEGLPRTIVNIMPIFDISPLPTISTDAICDTIQAVACPCGAFEEHHAQIQQEHRDYVAKVTQLINGGKYEKEDFTVVYQPFLKDTKVPKDTNGRPDTSYFAPDCFHFSEKAHKASAINLWNSLFIAVGKKPTSITFKEEIQCPAPGAYIKTNKNSNSKDETIKEPLLRDIQPELLVVEPRGNTGGSSDMTNSMGVGVAVVGGVVLGVLLIVFAALIAVGIAARKKAARQLPTDISRY